MIPGPAGPPGQQGPAGQNGVDGKNAYSITTTNFIVPGVGQNVTVHVDTADWMQVGMILFIGTAGWYELLSRSFTNGGILTVRNLGWPGNAVPGTQIVSGVRITVSGPKGADGASGAPLTAMYWISRNVPSELPQARNLSQLATGYLRVVNGIGDPVTVQTIPVSDLNSGSETTGKVYKPNGAGGVVAAKVFDNELDHAVVTVPDNIINWALGRVFFKALTVDVALGFTNAVPGKAIQVVLKQATTPRTVTWTAPIKWPGGTPIPMTTNAGAYAIYSFLYVDGVYLVSVINDRR